MSDRSFEDMTPGELLHEARRWRFNAEVARDELRRFKAGDAALRDESAATLARVWALCDRKRKTVRMADLMAVFTEGETVHG